MFILLKLFKFYTSQFRQLLTDEEFMTIMKVNKNFRMLTIDDEYVLYTLKYKGYELNKIHHFYYVYKIYCKNKTFNKNKNENDTLFDDYLSHIDKYICTNIYPNNVINSCNFLYMHYHIYNRLIKHHPKDLHNEELIRQIIIDNEIELFEWYFQKGFCDNINILDISVKVNNYNFLKWTIENKIDKKIDKKISAFSLINISDINILELLIENNIHIDEDFCEIISIYNRYDILKWIIENKKITKNIKITNNICFYNIFRNDDLYLFKFFIDKGFKLKDTDHYAIYKNKAYKILKWAIQKNIYTSKIDYEHIIKDGKIDILKLVFKKGFVCNIDIVYCASRYNKIDILKWIIENTNIHGKIASNNIIKYDNPELLNLCFIKNFVIKSHIINVIIY